jgi:hypothetical protein
MKKATKKKLWKWTKIVAGGVSIVAVVRESYLAFGSRREERRAVYEQAVKRAAEAGVPLLVLGDPDKGLMSHLLGRSWQCGDGSPKVICIDPAGCGVCPDQIQGWPEDVLARMADNSAVIYDPGTGFPYANDGAALAKHMQRVAVADGIFMHDVEPLSLAAFFEPKRKRRVIVAPQTNTANTIVWEPSYWRKEPSTGVSSEQSMSLAGLYVSKSKGGGAALGTVTRRGVAGFGELPIGSGVFVDENGGVYVSRLSTSKPATLVQRLPSQLHPGLSGIVSLGSLYEDGEGLHLRGLR